MSINIGPPSVEELRPRITVIGVGGAGGNAIANMIQAEIEGVDFIVANTDAQALNNAAAEHRIQLGPEITQGLGAGSRPEVGRAAAEETVDDIERALEGVNMVFIAAGMGGGTGTGAAPVIAEIARAKGILTVGVVTKPFLFEGTRRMRAADAGIDELQKNVDTLIVIPNQNLFLVAKAETTFKEAFMLADEVLQQGVRSITDLMVMPGLINLDFADIRSVMNEMGKAMMGTGEGEGENRALEAAERAIANPLLDGVSMQGAKGVIISIIGGEDMKLLEVDEAANHIRELVDPEANIIWGSAFNPDLDGRIRVSVVATGIDQTAAQTQSTARPMTLGSARGPKKPIEPLEAERAAPAPDPAGGLDLAAQDDDDLEPLDLSSGGRQLDEGTPEPEKEHEAAVHIDSNGMPDGSADGDGFGGPVADDPWRGESRPDPSGKDAAEKPDGRDMFDLTQEADAEQPATEGRDELLLDASRLAAADEQVHDPSGGEWSSEPPRESANAGEPDLERPRNLAAPSGGSTLFERMANLSRSSRGSEEEDEDGEDEEDDGSSSALRIPRFLGRQNNQ